MSDQMGSCCGSSDIDNVKLKYLVEKKDDKKGKLYMYIVNTIQKFKIQKIIYEMWENECKWKVSTFVSVPFCIRYLFTYFRSLLLFFGLVSFVQLFFLEAILYVQLVATKINNKK